MASDKSGVKFALNNAGGSAFTTATVSLTHVPASTPYLQSVFHDVQVVSVSVGSTGGGAVPDMDLTFSYRSVEIEYAAESDCSLASRSWEGLSHVTPAVDPATGGVATDPLQTFLPVQLGTSGPGAVNVGDPTQADTLLNANGANGLSNLRAQTLATRLNVVSGALDPALVSSPADAGRHAAGRSQAQHLGFAGSRHPGSGQPARRSVQEHRRTCRRLPDGAGRRHPRGRTDLCAGRSGDRRLHRCSGEGAVRLGHGRRGPGASQPADPQQRVRHPQPGARQLSADGQRRWPLDLHVTRRPGTGGSGAAADRGDHRQHGYRDRDGSPRRLCPRRDRARDRSRFPR